MRRVLRAAFSGALMLALAACAELGLGMHGATGVPEKPEQLVVRSFVAPERAIVLDPSFGFSLRRGQPGVPRAERAAGVSRAAAFALGEGVVETLRAAGLDARSTLQAGGAPPEDAVVVGGVFDKIDQGRRRHVGRVGPGEGQSRVVADARIEAPGGGILLTVHAHSDHIADEGGSGDTARVRGVRVTIADANRDAGRVGREIGRQIVDFARRSNWLPAAQ